MSFSPIIYYYLFLFLFLLLLLFVCFFVVVFVVVVSFLFSLFFSSSFFEEATVCKYEKAVCIRVFSVKKKSLGI